MSLGGWIITISLFIALLYVPFFRHFLLILLVCTTFSMIISLIAKFVIGIINLIKYRRWSNNEED